MKKWIPGAAVGAAILLIIGTAYLFVKDAPNKKAGEYLKETYPGLDFSLHENDTSNGNIWTVVENETGTEFHVIEGNDGDFVDDLYGEALAKAFSEYQKDMVPISCWGMTIIADSNSGKNAELYATVSGDIAEDTFIELNSLLHYMHTHKYPINITVTVKSNEKQDLVMTLTDVMPQEQVTSLIKEYGGDDEEISVQ